MIENASHEEILKSLDYSAQSEFHNATRRIIYNFSEQSLKDRGYFHVDVMSGIGSGLIVYQNFRFFLLTAKHNLRQLYPTSLRNESPIWVPIEHPPKWSSMSDFFMGRRVWYIGELIEVEGDCFDAQDIVLIEFFLPLKPRSVPRQFINVESQDYFLQKDQFFEKQILMCSGYPSKTNSYKELASHPEYSQSTTFILEHKFGFCSVEGCDELVKFDSEKKITHAELNGFSGGPVCSVYFDESEVKLAGISLSGDGGILRFLPAYMFHNAIRSYRHARCEILDEASNLSDETERPDIILNWFCEMESADESLRMKLNLT